MYTVQALLILCNFFKIKTYLKTFTFYVYKGIFNKILALCCSITTFKNENK